MHVQRLAAAHSERSRAPHLAAAVEAVEVSAAQVVEQRGKLLGWWQISYWVPLPLLLLPLLLLLLLLLTLPLLMLLLLLLLMAPMLVLMLVPRAACVHRKPPPRDKTSSKDRGRATASTPYALAPSKPQQQASRTWLLLLLLLWLLLLVQSSQRRQQRVVRHARALVQLHRRAQRCTQLARQLPGGPRSGPAALEHLRHQRPLLLQPPPCERRK
jgi:hypothetical protein